MKKLLTICIFTLLTTLLTAQISKKINVATAGTLTNLLTATEKTTVTDLTVTGNIDARDIKCMRNEMTVLANLDITAVTIMSYNGTGGTSTETTSYPANVMPDYSFYNSYLMTGKTTLKTVLLPNSITSIGSHAFYACQGLNRLVLPNSLILIGYQAFCWCTNLTNLIIPNSVTTIGSGAFLSCGRLTNITLGSGVTSIGDEAFAFSYIKIINSLNVTPPTLGNTCFASSYSNVSAVYVTASAVTAYKSAPGWSDFFSSVIQKFQYRVSLKDASTGTMNLICDYGATPSFDFTPATGWRVNTVLYNGVDVTSSLVDGIFTVPALTDNALLNVSLVSTSSGAPELINNRVKVYSTRSEIIVDGTSEGETVTLYTLNGKQLQTVKSHGESLNIPVERDAVYLVKTGERTFKVIL